MHEIKWVDNHIEIDPPKRTKKITGTRFATILGLNPWSTEFEMWCAITKTWEKPFEDTIYTVAGKTIEPKQAEYMKKSYGMDIMTPTDVYGEDYFSKTYGDFFRDKSTVFGGMWDYLSYDEDGNLDAVLEMKTTKRIEDWQDDIPEYYALQAALYAYLLGVDNVIMVASFLEDKDYEHPENFVPSFKNTITVEFKVSERYPNFEDIFNDAAYWWDTHVKTGISPDFDEKKDAEILKALRTNSLSPETDISALVKEAEELKKIVAEKDDAEKRLKKVNDLIKKYAMENFREGDKSVEVKGSSYVWTLSRGTTSKTVYNEELMKADGVFDKYASTKEDTSYRMTVKEIKEGK